ncbi:MAG: hypothetical protein Q4E51_08635 [Lachnospiraceae bacterium]|nr:hypothetical protein [Lachnospiraceae bacterium]
MKRFVSEDCCHGDTAELISWLCTPHTEEYVVRVANMNFLEDDPAVPDEVFIAADRGWKGYPLSDYEFNSIWTFTEGF